MNAFLFGLLREQHRGDSSERSRIGKHGVVSDSASINRNDLGSETTHEIPIFGRDREHQMSHASRQIGIDLLPGLFEIKHAGQQDRFFDGGRVTSDAFAMVGETADLVTKDLGSAERIPHLCVPRDDSQRNVLTGRADENRWMGLLQRLRIEAGIL